MNLGPAELEDGDLDAAMDALSGATLFDKDHREAHFNLALIYMQRGML
jgi:Tfp pilus assembly protein PilF